MREVQESRPIIEDSSSLGGRTRSRTSSYGGSPPPQAAYFILSGRQEDLKSDVKSTLIIISVLLFLLYIIPDVSNIKIGGISLKNLGKYADAFFSIIILLSIARLFSKLTLERQIARAKNKHISVALDANERSEIEVIDNIDDYQQLQLGGVYRRYFYVFAATATYVTYFLFFAIGLLLLFRTGHEVFILGRGVYLGEVWPAVALVFVFASLILVICNTVRYFLVLYAPKMKEEEHKQWECDREYWKSNKNLYSTVSRLFEKLFQKEGVLDVEAIYSEGVVKMSNFERRVYTLTLRHDFLASLHYGLGEAKDKNARDYKLQAKDKFLEWHNCKDMEDYIEKLLTESPEWGLATLQETSEVLGKLKYVNLMD